MAFKNQHDDRDMAAQVIFRVDQVRPDKNDYL